MDDLSISQPHRASHQAITVVAQFYLMYNLDLVTTMPIDSLVSSPTLCQHIFRAQLGRFARGLGTIPILRGETGRNYKTRVYDHYIENCSILFNNSPTKF